MDDLEPFRALAKAELHQHVDGSIPVETIWALMRENGLVPVDTVEEMQRLLVLQREEEGSLLSYLDKFHYPLWITQFFENISLVVYEIVREAHARGVEVLELRYSPIIHTRAGLTLRQTIQAVLTGMNRAQEAFGTTLGLIIIAMRQHGPHIAKILARQAISEAQHLHRRSGVVGFDIAGAESGNPPNLFQEAYEIARSGGLGLTAHAGEDEGPQMIWQAIDELGCRRIGHGCAAIRDAELMRRLARDEILVECCITSNRQTGAAPAASGHPIRDFLEAGIPVAICTDNTTVSDTDQVRESAIAASLIGRDAVSEIHRRAVEFSFIPRDRLPADRKPSEATVDSAERHRKSGAAAG